MRALTLTLGVMMLTALTAKTAEAAGAAYVVDTAEVSEPGACKVESWYSAADNHDAIAAISPTCVANLGRPVELNVQFNRARADGEWATAATPKFKTNLVPSAIGQFGVAISGGASYDLVAGQNTGYFANIPATLRLSETARINLNGGWQWDSVAGRHYLTYGAGVDWRTPDNVWTLTGEVFGLAGAAVDSGTVAPRFQLGLRWRPVDSFNIDLIYGRNLAGENANWVTVATTVRFPPIK